MRDLDVDKAAEATGGAQEGAGAQSVAPGASSMFGAATRGLGAGLLQRKLARRWAARSGGEPLLQRKAEGEDEGSPDGGGGDEGVVVEELVAREATGGAEGAAAGGKPGGRAGEGGGGGAGGGEEAAAPAGGEAAEEVAEFGDAGQGQAGEDEHEAEHGGDAQHAPGQAAPGGAQAELGEGAGASQAPGSGTSEVAPGAGKSGPTTAPGKSAAPAGPAVKTPEQQAKEDLRNFRKHGVYGPQDITPSTGLGGFQAAFDPHRQVLDLKLKGGVTFTDGISTTAAGVLTANHPDLNAIVAALNISIPSGKKRAAFVRKNYAWGKASKQRFVQEFRDSVQTTWNKPYRFHCTRPFWGGLTSGTKLKVAIHSGAKKANEHLSIEGFKTAPGVNIGAFVAPGAANNPFDQKMSIGSNSTRPRTDNLLRSTVAFNPGTATMANPAVAAQLMNTYQAANPASGGQAPPIVLHAYCSEAGNTRAQNRALAGQRGKALSDAIAAAATAAGINFRMGRVTVKVHDPGKSHAADRQRVELVVDGGQAQVVAAHEAGHALGLDDEYAINAGGTISGTGAATGTATSHDASAKTIGTSGSVNENNAGIMSLGSKVQLEHYATFGEALRTVTSVPQWQIQAK